MIPVVLTIAGSDSSGGAGLQGDLRTFAACGVWGASAITAVTAQDTRGVAAVFPLPAEAVARQIEVVCRDLTVAAAKTGMLATAAIVEAVAAAVTRHALPHLVVDPVVASSRGDALLTDGGVEAYRRLLLPVAAVVTPNLDEAERLLGHPVRDVAAMREAAAALVGLGARAAIVKGGHLEGDAVDVLCDAGTVVELAGPRLETGGVHGTGCAFSAALAARLAGGADLASAARAAKAYVTEGIRTALAVGRGRRVLAPDLRPVPSVPRPA